MSWPFKDFFTLDFHLSGWKYGDFCPGPRDGGGPLKFIWYILLTGHNEEGLTHKIYVPSRYYPILPDLTTFSQILRKSAGSDQSSWSRSLLGVLTHYSLVCLPWWNSKYREMVTDRNLGRRWQKVGHLNVSAAVHSETLSILTSSLWDEWNRCSHAAKVPTLHSVK